MTSDLKNIPTICIATTAEELIDFMKELPDDPKNIPTPRTDAEMPGAWICDKCKFILQKNFMFTGDGSIRANTSPLNEICPNDGTLMRPFTWREANEDFAEDNQRLRGELTLAQQEIEKLKEDKERLDMDNKFLTAVCDAAWDVSAFSRDNDFQVVNSSSFFKFAELLDKLQTELLKHKREAIDKARSDK